MGTLGTHCLPNTDCWLVLEQMMLASHKEDHHFLSSHRSIKEALCFSETVPAKNLPAFKEGTESNTNTLVLYLPFMIPGNITLYFLIASSRQSSAIPTFAFPITPEIKSALIVLGW